MTPQMKKCYNYLSSYIADKGYSPSYNEIQEHLKLNSKSGVFRIVKSLEYRGKIKTTPYCSRSIELADDSNQIELEHAYDFLEQKGLLKEFLTYIANK